MISTFDSDLYFSRGKDSHVFLKQYALYEQICSGLCILIASEIHPEIKDTEELLSLGEKILFQDQYTGTSNIAQVLNKVFDQEFMGIIRDFKQAADTDVKDSIDVLYIILYELSERELFQDDDLVKFAFDHNLHED